MIAARIVIGDWFSSSAPSQGASNPQYQTFSLGYCHRTAALPIPKSNQLI